MHPHPPTARPFELGTQGRTTGGGPGLVSDRNVVNNHSLLINDRNVVNYDLLLVDDEDVVLNDEVSVSTDSEADQHTMGPRRSQRSNFGVRPTRYT